MLYLLFSILCASLIFVVFKLFETFGINTLQAIIFNYAVACTCGIIFYKGDITLDQLPGKPWFLGTLALGVLFIAIFNLMAATTQKMGVSVTSVATKMSLVVPVVFGVLMYNEVLGTLKVVGILIALLAVYYTSAKENSIEKVQKISWLFPLGVFLGSGIIDTSLKFIQERMVHENDFPIFSATVFGAAAFIGFIITLVKKIKRQPFQFSVKNIIAGVALGTLNYFSIYFLLKALKSNGLNSASIFTINNVAIVLFSTLLGILLFKERLSAKNWLGVALAVVSILLVALF
ncbi:EamA family transporter [Euzebyella saccharophila]|uniref:EamA family transporter n=1 Tax=Euzebyella saccharophila TaxID=679664 RepID=A0ABV8JRU0_9FLAO|nr:EamA family transporter [Euzebyella saccharophila]